MSPGSSTESYPAFARIRFRENPRKNLNQVTCPDRDSNPGHLVSQSDALTVTPQTESRPLIVNSTELLSIVRSRNIFAFSSDERTFNIESYFRTEVKIEFTVRKIAHTNTVTKIVQLTLKFNRRSTGSLKETVFDLQKIQDRTYSHSSFTVTVRSKNIFAFSNDERAFNIASFSHRYCRPFAYVAFRFSPPASIRLSQNRLRTVMQEKKAEIESEFYGTDAMINRNWTGPNNKLRSAITRLAVHTNCAEDQSTTNLPRMRVQTVQRSVSKISF
ncbi:hypothetical protein ANN_23138 [Periplaneta americana]|uniref:Uncharacterized protein n=1 Tax=Periplaneta americana TaxID=6978 RepID=A0ABQ8SKC3_PERAM|nr:hypothetical protein ANN_23138 [Periplaneta americana]